jgi:hypothetical protein
MMKLVYNLSIASSVADPVRIRIRRSVPLTMDPDPDPAIFVIDLQDANKKQFFPCFPSFSAYCTF